MSPEKMTTQIRLYLACDALRHLSFGLAMVLMPRRFNPSIPLLFDIAPTWVWVSSLLVGAAHLSYSATSGSEVHARLALVMSATVSMLWALDFFLVGAATLGLSILFVTLGAKDLVICYGPMHTSYSALFQVRRP